MDHTMILSYDYSNRNRRRRRTNAPPSRAISMDMAMRRWNTERISRLRRSRAFIKATKLRQRATTRSVLPRRPPGTQSTQRWATCPPPLLAILMAVVMRRCYTPRIARWRRFVAFIKATKRHHGVSTCSDINQPDMPPLVVSDISSWKRAPVDMLAPNNNRGMTYQTDEKHLTIFPEYFVGVVKLAIAINRYSNRFLYVSLPIIFWNIYKIGHWENS